MKYALLSGLLIAGCATSTPMDGDAASPTVSQNDQSRTNPGTGEAEAQNDPTGSQTASRSEPATDPVEDDQWWKSLTHEQRMAELDKEAESGNERARQLKASVKSGRIEPDLLARIRWPIPELPPLDLSTAQVQRTGLMPFGRSMFGPWETGEGFDSP
ncbi:MAG: hypothetical protein IT464_12165 [Planctomycetes bacterium]|nr:hypothetical protein [Planctomycetota bacterium]